MKTQAQILAEAKTESLKSAALDGRDFSRLVDYFPVSQWKVFGFSNDGGNIPQPKAWTKENILDDLKTDLAFAFEKALGQRGLSAHAMYSVVKMWMHVLNDEELSSRDDDDYTYYGLPFLKKVAVKYGLPNEIGDDNGDERKYSGYED